MKRMILLTVLLALVCTVSFGKRVVAKGQTFTAMGDYRIETTDNPVTLKGNDCTAYKIRYENSPLEVTVIVCKGHKCRMYVVLSDKLSVQYVCNEYYFGVERLDKSFESEGYTTSDTNLNRVEYFHQKVLGPGQRPELEATQLIAAYFPLLLKPVESLTAAM
ncbi:MAG: hypothetical protein ABSA76_10595 [Bacteroidales bacterium]